MKGLRPIGIDLFAGAGGMSLGFEQAGFDVVAAVEIDPVHAAVHKVNFPDCAVLPVSVQNLDAASIRSVSGIGDKPVDMVFGGAPCQGFSLIGQRVLDDPRNSLVKDFVRIVKDLDASYFVFENVKGLTVGEHRKLLLELIDLFVDGGYAVRQEWRVLNAAHYGVPQDRQRLFLLGAKKNLPLPTYPEPQTVAPGNFSDWVLPLGPTCRDALDDLPDADQFEALKTTDQVKTSGWNAESDYAREMRGETPDAWHFGYRRKWNPNLLTSSFRTAHSSISRTRFAATKPGAVEPISRFFKLSADGVSNTLRAGTDGARGAFTSPRPIHYRHNRCVTVREMARLHGFPDWFRFQHTKWHGARQIGNAVPPPLARAVARAVMEAMGIRATRPAKVIQPAEEGLLRMDLSSAAKYWNVPVPPSKRTFKSGVKKRSQFETEQARLKRLAS